MRDAEEGGRGGWDGMEGEGGAEGFEMTRSRVRDLDDAVGAAKEEDDEAVGVFRPVTEDDRGVACVMTGDPGMDEPLGVGERRGREVEMPVDRFCIDRLRSIVREGVASRSVCDFLLRRNGVVRVGGGGARDDVELAGVGVIGTGLRRIEVDECVRSRLVSIRGGMRLAPDDAAAPRKSALELEGRRLVVRVRTRSRAAVLGAGGGPACLRSRGTRSTAPAAEAGRLGEGPGEAVEVDE